MFLKCYLVALKRADSFESLRTFRCHAVPFLFETLITLIDVEEAHLTDVMDSGVFVAADYHLELDLLVFSNIRL